MASRHLAVRAARLRAIPPVKKPEDAPDGLERIKVLTQAARTTWFTYLGVLAFTGVTLLGVEDVDFFALDRSTDLPLIGISVPVTFFFGAGALITTIVFVYLHVFLEQLWYALGKAEARIKDEPLAAHVHPWLVSEMALNVRRWLRRKDEAERDAPCVETSPLGNLGVGASALLLYAAGPGVLGWLWYRSMPAHDAGMTAGIGVLLAIVLWSTWASLNALADKLRLPEMFTPSSRAPNRRRWYRGVVMVVAAVALVGVSVMRTEWDFEGYEKDRYPWNMSRFERVRNWFRPVPADLREARLTALPEDWLSREDAKKAFYKDWCDRPDTEECSDVIPQDGAFQTEWLVRRKTYLDVQPKPNFQSRDLTFARLRSAFLPGLDLRDANLNRADLSSALLEGVILSETAMQGADLSGAELQGADLSGAELQGAVLSGAKMQGADLSGADMQGADLSRAEMQGADLAFADMQGADLGGAELQKANFKATRLQGTAFSREHIPGVYLYFGQYQWLGKEAAGVAVHVSKDATGTSMISSIDPEITKLRFVDLSEAAFDGYTDLRNSFGDRTVILPLGVLRPCQWGKPDEDLSEFEFMGRWRGWVDAKASGDIWQFVAPDGYEAVPPIPPPDGCEWKTEPIGLIGP